MYLNFVNKTTNSNDIISSTEDIHFIWHASIRVLGNGKTIWQSHSYSRKTVQNSLCGHSCVTTPYFLPIGGGDLCSCWDRHRNIDRYFKSDFYRTNRDNLLNFVTPDASKKAISRNPIFAKDEDFYREKFPYNSAVSSLGQFFFGYKDNILCVPCAIQKARKFKKHCELLNIPYFPSMLNFDTKVFVKKVTFSNYCIFQNQKWRDFAFCSECDNSCVFAHFTKAEYANASTIESYVNQIKEFVQFGKFIPGYKFYDLKTDLIV